MEKVDKMAVKIITDTSSNITIEEAKELNIDMLPISINFDGIDYKDQYELSTDMFYEKLVSSKGFPKTSQLSPAEIFTHFSKAKENEDEVITLFISSNLSGTYNTSCMIKNEIGYDKIYNVDNLNTVIGLRIMVMEACRLRDEGKTALEIVEHINQIVPRVKTFAVVNTLEFLNKGGRVSKAAMVIGEFLKVKPIIAIEEGLVVVKGKCRGTIKASEKIKEFILENPIDENYPVYYVYTMIPENLRRLINIVSADIDINVEGQVNLVGSIGCHIGPNGAGIIYVSKE